jgi:hypothetical protein
MSYTSHELPPLASSFTLFPTTGWAMNVCELTLAVSHPHRSRTGTTRRGTWRMSWRVRERSRSSSPSQLWVAGPLSPYNVITYLFCIELRLYSKDVKFDHVPWFIICVHLVLAHLVIMFAPGSWCPETRVWQKWYRRNVDCRTKPR